MEKQSVIAEGTTPAPAPIPVDVASDNPAAIGEPTKTAGDANRNTPSGDRFDSDLTCRAAGRVATRR